MQRSEPTDMLFTAQDARRSSRAQCRMRRRLETELAARARETEQRFDVTLDVEIIDLGPGTVVAELGAGEGELTVLVAKAIGETGRIFSNEVNPERVQQISRTVAREGLKNVTVVTGEGKSANDKGQ